jgi:hypothetical protein
MKNIWNALQTGTREIPVGSYRTKEGTACFILFEGAFLAGKDKGTSSGQLKGRKGETARLFHHQRNAVRSQVHNRT